MTTIDLRNHYGLWRREPARSVSSPSGPDSLFDRILSYRALPKTQLQLPNCVPGQTVTELT